MDNDIEAMNAAYRRSLRRKMIGATFIAALGIAAACFSILGQGIAYRQMRALESISAIASEHCK